MQVGCGRIARCGHHERWNSWSAAWGEIAFSYGAEVLIHSDGGRERGYVLGEGPEGATASWLEGKSALARASCN